MAGQSKCVSSQLNIHVKRDSYAHQYDVTIIFNPASGRRPRQLTRGGDAFQKARCRHILQNLDPLHGTFYAYDGQAALWTSKALEDGIKDARFQFDEYMHDSLNDEGEIFVTLIYVRSISLSDFSIYTHGTPDANEDRTLRNVLEMILSQDALERQQNRFAATGPGQLCETTERQFGRGFVTRNGNSKGVHIVKSPQGPQPLLAITNFVRIFYPSGVNLLDVLHNFWGNQRNYDEAARAFRGVKLQLMYNPGRTLNFRGFSELEMRDITFTEGERQVRFDQYYQEKYNVVLNHLNYRGAVMAGGDAVFPLEQLLIVPDQPVPVNYLPANIREDGLRINRLPPNQRHDSIIQQVALLRMNNPVSEGFGIRVEETMIRGTFTRLNKASIIARNNSRLQPNDFGVFKFDKNQYVIPGRCKQVIVLSSARDAQTSMTCAKAAVVECRKKGIQLSDPTHVEFNTQNRHVRDWVNVMTPYKNENALVVIVDSGTETHALIKLAEALTGVPTQHLLWKTAASVVHKWQTLENIAHKVNLKTGGLNHKVDFNGQTLDLNKGNILVIGLDVCHPTGEQSRGPTPEPSPVGITANFLEAPCAFAGTFFFQEARQESVTADHLRAYVYQMLVKVSKYRKIDTIVLTRDGVSEGQYKMALDQELHAIRQASNDFFKHAKTRLIGIIVTKSGNVRHFNVSNNRPESLPCRSIVSFGTRENYRQFYMVPHRAFQGTAKAVLVTVIQDDLNLGPSAIQNFVMSLTTLHQIVCAPVSLPEPIYQADKLAQRGQILFRTFQRFYPNQVPRLQGGQLNFAELTTLISFNGGQLPSIRFTA
jgi:hypothetical protein